MARTVFHICDGDQRLLLLPDRSSILRLALGSSQDEAELLILFMDGVVHQANHTRLLALPWRGKVNVFRLIAAGYKGTFREQRGGLTWQESNDRSVSVGSFAEVHHDLSGALAGVAAHRGPDVDVSTAVHDGCHLPVGLVHLVAPFLKLNLGHCKDRSQVVTGESLSVFK